MLKVLDLFSGIGGFSLGLERTGGFKTVAFCEIDPFCRKVLKKHWPDVPIYEDIRSLDGSGITADVITGGFPCQDISLANRNATGISGERSGLWREYARLIGEIRPRYVIVENSPALRFRGLGRVLGDLAGLGYDAEWRCYGAVHFGAQHERRRIWILAYPDQVGRIWGRRQASQGIDWQGILPQRLVGEQGPWDCSAEEKSQLLGMGDGVPDGSHRIGACGNSVIPQIPEYIGRTILAAEKLKAAQSLKKITVNKDTEKRNRK